MSNLKMRAIGLVQALLPHGVINSRRAYKDFFRLGIESNTALKYALSPSKVAALRFCHLQHLAGGSIPNLEYVVDVGAHEGKWSSSILSLCQPKKLVVIEPSPVLQPLLQQKFCNLSNVRVLSVAVSDMKGKTEFSLTFNQEFNSISKVKDELQDNFHGLSKVVETVEVDVDTLDSLLNEMPEISLLKIDVQGYEKKVLKGAKNTLSKTKYLIIEINFVPLYEGESLFSELHEMLVDLGFCLRNIVPSYCHDGRSLAGDAIYGRIQ